MQCHMGLHCKGCWGFRKVLGASDAEGYVLHVREMSLILNLGLEQGMPLP